MDLLGNGLDWLERQRERFLARPVRYRRGSMDLPVPATVGRTLFRLAAGPGAHERIESRDFLIAATHLAALEPPQRGDRIVEEADGRRHTYEVLAPGGEPHWRWSDPNRRAYRIHTKHLSTESIP